MNTNAKPIHSRLLSCCQSIACLLLCWVYSSAADRQGGRLALQLTTKLGVKTEVEVASLSQRTPSGFSGARDWAHGDLLSRAAVTSFTDPQLALLTLRLSDGVYVAFMPEVLSQIDMIDGSQVIKLPGGLKLKGRICTVVSTDDDRQYDLGTATAISVATPRGHVKQSPKESEEKWNLKLGKPSDVALTLINPHFEYLIAVGAAPVVFAGGVVREGWSGSASHQTKSFEFKVGNEDQTVNVTDFASLSFIGRSGDRCEQVVVTGDDGTETSGSWHLIVPVYGGKGAPNDSCLVATIADSAPETKIILFPESTYKLTKTAQKARRSP